MKMFLFNRKQKVKRWLVDKDFIEVKMTEQINAAAKLVFSVPLKKRLPATYFFAAIPQPRGSGYLLFKIVTEQVQSDRVQYTCIEAAYDELKSYHYIKDDRPQNRSAADMLQMALDGTRWSVGTAYDAGTGSTNFYYISSLEAIQKIADLFKLEVTFSIFLDPNSHQIVRRLVNLYAQQGRRTGKRFEYGSNLLSVEREESSENLITALIGRGKGEEKYHTADGKPAEEDQTPDGYGRRINFADVVWSTDNGNPVNKPAGQEYVEDPDATAAYGFDDGKPRIGIETFEDITDPGELLQATWSALQTLKRPKVSFKANTLDVGDLGLGDTVAIIRHDIKIEYFTRVYKVEHNLLNEKQNTIELGDDFNSQSITSAINSIASAVKQTNQTANYASVSANGKNTNNYGKDKPTLAVEGDLWYKDLGNGEVDLYQYHDGNWILITSTRDLHNVQEQVEKAQSELETAKNDIITNKQKADTDIENLNKSIEDNKKVADKSIENLNKSIEDNKRTADESLQKLNDSVANLQGQYDNNIVPDLNKAATDAADALQKYIEAQKSITDLTKQAQQQGTDIANITSNVNGLSADFANLQGDVNSTKVDVKGIQATLGTATGDIAQLKLDAQSLQTMLAGKVDDSVYQNFVTLTNQALAAKLTASDLTGYAKTVDVQATANGLQLNIDSVNGRLDNLKVGTRNLLHGTSDQYKTLVNDNGGGWLQKTTASTNNTSAEDYHAGDQFTYAATVDNTSNQPVMLEVLQLGQDWQWTTGGKQSESVPVGAKDYRVSVNFQLNENTTTISTWLIFQGGNGAQGEQIQVKDERLVLGTVSNTWLPNPDDTAQDLTQLSARITANSQQFSSYYTKSETDAKADTAKNDAVNAIKGDANWTGLTNIITNSGFLQSVDGFVQKVQQTTLPMFNGGGVNLQTGTGDCSLPFSKNNGSIAIEKYDDHTQMIHNYGEWAGFYLGYASGYFIPEIGETYTFSADIKGKGSIDGDHFKWEGSDSVSMGNVSLSDNWQRISNTVHVSTLTGTWIIYPTSDSSGVNDFYVKHIKIERGSVATPWSPNPADLATQVAFTELTQTVQGLRSTVSGNYGTLQTQISQTAAAIRGELSDQISGVTNQITTTANGLNVKISNLKIGTRNLLHNTSDQYRTLTGDGWMGVSTSSNSMTPVSQYHTGDQFTYAATISNTSDVLVELQVWQCDQNKNRLTDGMLGMSAYIQPGESNVQVFATGQIDSNTRYLQTSIYSSGGQSGTHTIQVKDERLVEGSYPGTWSPNPDDIAGQFTEINATLNGLQSTVSRNYGDLQTQLSQTDTAIRGELTNAASGLQTQITTTANGLNARISAIQVGGRNLLHNTSDEWESFTGGYWGCFSTASSTYTSTAEYHAGDQFTYSATVTNSGTHPVMLEAATTTDGQAPISIFHSDQIQPGQDNARVKVTLPIDANTKYIRTYLVFPESITSNETVKIKDEQLEEGTMRTPWTPNPEDITSQFAEVNATINGLQSTVSGNYSALQSQINQTATTIRGEVTNSVSGLQTQITQQANSFNVSLSALRSETAWQKVTTAIDANNYTTTGNYWIQAAPNSNTPDGSAWAYLQVVAYPDVQRIKQTWQRDNNVNEAYTRLKTGNNWSEWQKTVTAGNIMAQINMSAGTTLIQNDKIYMDAGSTIFSGKAFIPSAAITDLSADKITTGTLNAGNVNIINMNADNIVAGTIKGTNLSIGLNSGEVEFQHGRIHNFDNTVDINLDQAYISTANNNILGATRALLKDGELQLTQPNIFDTNGDWYFRLFNGGGSGDAFAGGSLVGKNNVTVANKNNYQGATGLSASPVGEASFAGLFVGKGNSWMPTLLEGAERGVFIKGGKSISSEFMHGGPLMPGSPYISVGSDSSGANFWDNRIVIDAEYVHIPSAQRQTTGSSPNLFIADDGALVRSTSASKYKTDIQRSHSLDYGERLLSLPTATWIDKAESRRYASGESDMKPVTHFGMIAEDLANAGLEMLVARGRDGELEGIQYDRIAPALLPVIKKLQDRIKKLEERLNG